MKPFIAHDRGRRSEKVIWTPQGTAAGMSLKPFWGRRVAIVLVWQEESKFNPEWA
jgi:hypothetical protein